MTENTAGSAPRKDREDARAGTALFAGFRERRRVRRLRAAERDLRDAAYYVDRWGFNGPPSRQEREKNAYLRLIRRVYELGGEPLDFMPFRMDYHVVEALPDAYHSVPPTGRDNQWRVERA